MSDEELPTTRYLLLYEQLRDELGDAYGYKAELARKLRISPSYVTKIASGKAGQIGPDVIERAMESLRLPRAWFYDETYVPLHYTGAQRQEEARPFVDALLERVSDAKAKGLREGAVELLEKHARKEASADDVRELAREVLRGVSPYAIAHRVLTMADEKEVRAEAAQLGLSILGSVPRPGASKE